MPTIVHFQIPSDDVERSKKFYSDLFGWKFEKFPSTSSEPMHEGMEYWLISTLDDRGNKALGGGMMKRQSPQQQGFTNFFDVKSVQDGGKVRRQSYNPKNAGARYGLFCCMHGFRE